MALDPCPLPSKKTREAKSEVRVRGVVLFIMGRPPCCDKIGVKKGPWTPEEDIVLVSYIQDHGPGNWRAVPTNTGLLRCSKSCRLRWTNYLRPGIKRGNFTDQEEKLIFHLQALLGNRWAAIASYLPERTDNDIKNYWNTHLKKKLRKLENGDVDDGGASSSGFSSYQSIPKGQWERRLQTDIHMAKQALCEALSVDIKPETLSYNTSPMPSTSTYASSTGNISRLLEGWMRNSPKSNAAQASSGSMSNTVASDSASTPEASETSLFGEEMNPVPGAQVPLSVLETWLFDENVGQGHENLLDNMSLDDSSVLF